ncbi:MAG: glycosyltransferase family 2 protein [Alphaproteobacteria bacterium]
MPKVTLIALTLNEIEGLKFIMPQIDPAWCDQIIIADGGSTDGSQEWCKEQGYEVIVQTRKGIRYGYHDVLPYIKGDIVVTLSPDGNCSPEFIPQLIEMVANGDDMAIGSRYLDDATSDDDDLVTGFGNWLFTRTINLLHGANYSDALNIFRAYKRSLVFDLDLHLEESFALPEKMFFTVVGWEPLMSVRAAKSKMRIGDLAVGEPERIGGDRKLQIIRWGLAYYFQFWRELWYWKPKPMEERGKIPDYSSENSPS